MSPDRTKVVLEKFQQLSELGVPKMRIAKELGISRQTLEYHLKKRKKVAETTSLEADQFNKMTAGDAERLMRELYRDGGVNASWIAARLSGSPHRSTVHRWLIGESSPDPHRWVEMATTLGLTDGGRLKLADKLTDTGIAIVREAVLYILENSSEADIRAKAVVILRQCEDVQR
jgi:DNA-binding CsgD family transcriptional regulator